MYKRRLSRALKREIAIEYIKSGKQRLEIAKKYNLTNLNMLSSWVNSYLTPWEIENKCLSLPDENDKKEEEMAKSKSQEVTVSAQDQSALLDKMQKEIKKLEAELKKSKDRELALNTLLDLAEEQGICVRKNSGAKQ